MLLLTKVSILLFFDWLHRILFWSSVNRRYGGCDWIFLRMNKNRIFSKTLIFCIFKQGGLHGVFEAVLNPATFNRGVI